MFFYIYKRIIIYISGTLIIDWEYFTGKGINDMTTKKGIWMSEDRLQKIIDTTVNTTVLRLRVAGLIRDPKKSAYQKTEELLRSYTALKAVTDQPYTMRLVEQIDDALKDIMDDPYYEIVPMCYFQERTREDMADYYHTTTTTISRNKSRLVNKLKVRLFSDDFIFELYF